MNNYIKQLRKIAKEINKLDGMFEDLYEDAGSPVNKAYNLPIDLCDLSELLEEYADALEE